MTWAEWALVGVALGMTLALWMIVAVLRDHDRQVWWWCPFCLLERAFGKVEDHY